MQINELDEINCRENSKAISVVVAFKDVKVRIVDAKGRLGQIQNLIDVYNITSRQPQSISPSCIVGELQDYEDDGCMKPYALCGRGFPH